MANSIVVGKLVQWSRMRTEDSIESDCKRVRVTIDQLGRVTLATMVTMVTLVTMARANKIWCVSCDIPDGGLSDAQGRGLLYLLSLHAGCHSS